MCERHRKVAGGFFSSSSSSLAWNDVGVGDTGQPLEPVALLVLPRHLDEETLRRRAEFREAPEAAAAPVGGQRHGQRSQGSPRARHELHVAQVTRGLQARALQQDMSWNSCTRVGSEKKKYKRDWKITFTHVFEERRRRPCKHQDNL